MFTAHRFGCAAIALSSRGSSSSFRYRRRLVSPFCCDTFAGVVSAVSPPHGQAEHFGKGRCHTVGSVRTAAVGDVPMQPVNVVELDGCYLQIAERRPDIAAEVS
jgi:hypothetical protein